MRQLALQQPLCWVRECPVVDEVPAAIEMPAGVNRADGQEREEDDAPVGSAGQRVHPPTAGGNAPAGDQMRGSVTPCCPWYFPFLSLYDTSGGSLPSKNSTCAMPSFA